MLIDRNDFPGNRGRSPRSTRTPQNRRSLPAHVSVQSSAVVTSTATYFIILRLFQEVGDKVIGVLHVQGHSATDGVQQKTGTEAIKEKTLMPV